MVVICLYSNKIFQHLLKQLLSYGTKIIKIRHHQNKTSVPPDLETKIISVLTKILNENYNKNEFNKNIINKQFPPKPGSKKIIQLIYFFILEPENIPVPETDDIVSLISDLSKRSRLFPFKEHLKKKVRELARVKYLYIHQTNECTIVDINKSISTFLKDSDLNLKIASNIIQYFISVPSFINENSEIIDNFFIKLKNKLETLEDNEITSINSTDLSDIISYTNIFLNTAELEKAMKSINECLNSCKNLRYLLKDDNEKFLYNEQKRMDNAYSIEGFKKVVDLCKSTVESVNSLLDSSDLSIRIPDNLFLEQEKIVDNNINILDHEFFDKQAHKLNNILNKALKNVRSKTMFSKSTISSSQILSKILNIIPKEYHSQVKSSLSDIDLVNASTDEIWAFFPNNIRNLINQDNFKQIIIHRNISINTNMLQARANALNNDSSFWVTLKRKVQVKKPNGEKIDAELIATPASELKIFPHLKEGTGICSKNFNSKNVINLWKTETKLQDGTALFSGIRHGNTRGKSEPSKDVILAAAAQQYGIETLQDSPENTIFNVKLGNVQLMTPSKKFIPFLLDKHMPLDQMNSFNQISENGPFTVDIKDKTNHIKKIKINLEKPILFNFGTNMLHYKLNMFAKSCRKENRESLIRLLGKDAVEYAESQKSTCISDFSYFERTGGEVGKYLDEKYPVGISDRSNGKPKKIIILSTQCLYIWKVTNGKGSKENPAAIQSRLCLLLYLIEYPVSFNCKSGKDRTGELSAEINDLALTIEANNGQVPDPYAKISSKEKVQLSEIYNATQSDLIAQANTGYKGLKVDFKGTTDRTGKLRGASKNAKS